MESEAKTYLGIDVSQATLELAEYGKSGSKQYQNSLRGIGALARHLKKRGAALIVVEATGGYEYEVVTR
ncbi:MAG: hypothetical protein AB8I58_06010 [Anaerolineales bacterium]|jgi:transposase